MAGTVVVALKGVIANIPVLLDNGKLYPASPAPVPIDAVIGSTGHQDVFQVDGATEHFDTVVQSTVNLHVLDDGVGATATQG